MLGSTDNNRFRFSSVATKRADDDEMNSTQNTEQQLNLLDLPEEMIELIVSYLDLTDLKIVAQSCHFLGEICGQRIGKCHEVTITDILTCADLITFKNSKRQYENINIAIRNGKLVVKTEAILEQTKLLSCMKIKLITFQIRFPIVNTKVEGFPYLNLLVPIFQRHTPNLKEISFTFSNSKIEHLPYLNEVHSCFQGYKLSFGLYLINEGEFGDTCNHYTALRGNMNFKLDQRIENVEAIFFHRCSRVGELEIKNLNAIGCNFIDKTFVMKHKETLRVFEWVQANPSIEEDFVLPCQLRSFIYSSKPLPISRVPTTLLSSQRYLREVCLHFVELTEPLLETLSKQHFLTKFILSNCTLEESLDTRKFEFIKDVFDVVLENLSSDVVEAILENLDKVFSLKCDCSFPKELDAPAKDKPRKLLKNLKVLKIRGEGISKHILSRIEAPNVEECHVSCIPTLFFGSTLLKILKVDLTLGPKQAENILKNLPSLEIVHFKVRFYKMLTKYILRNLNNILHFKLNMIKSGDSMDSIQFFIDWTLENFGINYTDNHFCSNHSSSLFYKTEKFSLEIGIK